MGRHIAQGIDALDQAITLPAEEAIAVNDLVKVTSGGYVRKFVQGQSAAFQNSAAGPTPAGSASNLTSYMGSGNDGGMPIRCIAAGATTFGVLHTGNNSGFDQTVNLRIFDPTSLVRLQSVQLSASTACQGARLIRSGANFVAAWIDRNNSNQVTVGVYDAVTGVTVTAPTAVQQLVAANSHHYTLRDLPNGEYVLAYNKVTSNDLAFRRFNAQGVVQGTEIVVAAAAGANAGLGIHPLAAGGFILSWSINGTAFRFARYNASGVLQGSVVAVSASSFAIASPSFDDRVIELANGSIATVDPATTGGVKLYDSAGTLLSTLAVGTSTGNGTTGTLVRKLAGGFHFLTAGFNAHFSDTGALLALGAYSPTGYPVRVFDRPGTGPVVPTVGTTAPGTGSWNMYLAGVAADLTALDATILSAASSGGYGAAGWWAEQLPNGLLLYTLWGSSSSGANGFFYPFQSGAASVLGVATTAAAAGAQVRVATAGKYTINQSTTNPQFDRRTATPQGSKGSTMGQQAVLEGLRP